MNRLPMVALARIRALWLKLSIVAASLLFTGVVCLAQNTQNASATNTGWVVLPITEYTALRRAAFPADTEPAPPPVEATLTRIDYDLKVDGDLASGEARLTVDVIKDGWVRVATPEGLMVREAQLDGREMGPVRRHTPRMAAESIPLAANSADKRRP